MAVTLGEKLEDEAGGARTRPSIQSGATAGAAASRKPYPEAAGLLLLALALLFNAILLAPEVRIERVPVNDLVFHLEASERLGQSIARGEPFLDPWVSQWTRLSSLAQLSAAAPSSRRRGYRAWPAVRFTGC